VAADLVKELQQNLNIVMSPKPQLPTTQFYGSQTEAVVRQFQKKFGLPITGQATLEVRSKLAQASKGGPRNHAWVYKPTEFRAVLKGLGYNIEPDGETLTDERSQQAIRDFQRQYNLIVDGVAGSQTQDVAGELVRNLQHNLNIVVKPSPRLPLNYFYGSQTEAAVRLFQQRSKLPVTGVASLEVRNKLNQAAKGIAR
jgi:peptidoglycan hydrolase-like protein with peptidoglycan-binding domain